MSGHADCFHRPRAAESTSSRWIQQNAKVALIECFACIKRKQLIQGAALLGAVARLLAPCRGKPLRGPGNAQSTGRSGAKKSSVVNLCK